VTPATTERTALEKDGHADAGTVKGRKFLDGKDIARHRAPPFCFLYSLYAKKVDKTSILL
jgi:hypothetical protein